MKNVVFFLNCGIIIYIKLGVIMDIYDKIKYLREKMNLSQEELANKLGYKSKTSIHKIEQKKTDLPLSKVKEFAKVLNTTPEFLLGYNELKKEKITKDNMAFFKSTDISDEDKKEVLDLLNEFYFKQKYEK